MKPKLKKQLPYDFIFDELEGVEYHVKHMFGGHGVYVGDKIIFILYKKEKLNEDMGIWVCIPNEHTIEMKKEYPQLQGVSFFEDDNSAWQVLRETDIDFEPLALEFCKLVKKGDPRIGRMPKPKKKKLSTKVEATVPEAPVRKTKKLEQANAKKAKKHLKRLNAERKRKK